jgi:hypothetical protein
MKVLVLVIYSENDPVYKKHLECWRLYSKSHPSFHVVFITLSEDIQTMVLKDDILYIPGKEVFPNVTYKTVKAFEYFLRDGYDLVLRTNMSSFWVFDNLLPIMETFPRQGLLAGELINGDLVSGAGMFISWDLCEILIKTLPYLETFQTYWPDDARISHFLRDFFGVQFQQTYPQRFDIVKRSQANEIHFISEETFHMRVYLKADPPGDRDLEPQIMRDLYERFYVKKLNNQPSQC